MAILCMYLQIKETGMRMLSCVSSCSTIGHNFFRLYSRGNLFDVPIEE